MRQLEMGRSGLQSDQHDAKACKNDRPAQGVNCSPSRGQARSVIIKGMVKKMA
jgi:hypothetical protein